MTIAHIVAPTSGPGVVAWVPAGLAVAAVAAAAFGPRHLRRLFAVAAAASLAALIVIAALAPSPPQPPGYRLTVLPADGSRVTTPVTVIGCGHGQDGSAVPVPGGDRVLSVSLDGRQLMTITGSRVVVDVPPGQHRLRLEVLTRDHVEYSPALFAEAEVTVIGTAPPALSSSC